MDTESAHHSDEALMTRLQEGDDHSLAPLMQRWELALKGFLYRLVGNRAEAEDLAQETFARVYLKRTSYRAGAKFSTWLFCIASNLAKNRLRWWKRRPNQSLDEWTLSGGEFEDENNGPNQVETSELQALRIAAVRTAVLALPFEQRNALVLFEYEERTMAEIAAIVGCTPKAIEHRLERARKALCKSLPSLLQTSEAGFSQSSN